MNSRYEPLARRGTSISGSLIFEKPKHISMVKADLYKEAVVRLDVRYYTGEDIESAERHEGQVCLSCTAHIFI